MSWSKWIRQIQRRLSIAFTAAVLAIFGAQGLGGTPNGQLIVWFPPFEGFPGPPGVSPGRCRDPPGADGWRA